MLIYLDSVIVIYLIDHTGTFQLRSAKRLAALVAAGDRIALSDLVRLECKVKPMALGDKVKIAGFEAFFARPDVQFVPMNTAVFDRATGLRAVHSFKVVDALHLAAAIESGCDSFLTNDLRLIKCGDIPMEALPP